MARKNDPPKEPSPGSEGNAGPAVSSMSNAELLNEVRRRFGVALAFLTTDELLDEVERRSVACVISAFNVAEGNKEQWHTRVKGSPIMFGVLGLKEQLAIELHLEALSKTREGK